MNGERKIGKYLGLRKIIAAFYFAILFTFMIAGIIQNQQSESLYVTVLNYCWLSAPSLMTLLFLDLPVKKLMVFCPAWVLILGFQNNNYPNLNTFFISIMLYAFVLGLTEHAKLKDVKLLEFYDVLIIGFNLSSFPQSSVKGIYGCILGVASLVWIVKTSENCDEEYFRKRLRFITCASFVVCIMVKILVNQI